MSLRLALVAPYRFVGSRRRQHADSRTSEGAAADRYTVDVFGPASGPLSDGEHALGRAVSITMGGTESGLGLDPRAFAAAARLGRGPFDVIHVHEPLTPLVPWVAVAAARAPLVGTFHVHRETGHRLYARWKLALTPLVRRLRARLVVSDAARRTVATHFPGDYEIVPNGIDVEEFRRPRPRPRALAPDRRVVLYVGRLEARKGVETLIRAMTSVRKTAPDVTLVIVGDGSERVSLTAQAGGDGAVHFAGRVADAELAAYVQAADVVCSPALGGESFGIVLLEAMACGKPIVASRIEGYEALVDKAGCARLTAPGDADALARELTALLAVARHAAPARRRRRRGRARVRLAGDCTPARRHLSAGCRRREERRRPHAVAFDEIGPVGHHIGEPRRARPEARTRPPTGMTPGNAARLIATFGVRASTSIEAPSRSSLRPPGLTASAIRLPLRGGPNRSLPSAADGRRSPTNASIGRQHVDVAGRGHDASRRPDETLRAGNDRGGPDVVVLGQPGCAPQDPCRSRDRQATIVTVRSRRSRAARNDSRFPTSRSVYFSTCR